jgi:hypothetical protein
MSRIHLPINGIADRLIGIDALDISASTRATSPRARG